MRSHLVGPALAGRTSHRDQRHAPAWLAAPLGQASLRIEQVQWPEEYERMTREIEEALPFS